MPMRYPAAAATGTVQRMNTAPAAIRVAVVEDDPRYRASLETLARHLPRFVLTAAYHAAEPLLARAAQAQRRGEPQPWDLVLMDIGLPQVDGIEATRKLKAMFPAVRVVVLTVFEEPYRVLAAICAGADGYLLKSALGAQIGEQLEQVAGHGAALSPQLAATVMNFVRVGNAHAFNHELPADLGLTPRQLDVLRELVKGQSYPQVARALNISLDTVRTHVRRIYAALQVHSVAEAAAYALRHGLV
ncbi:MULTISPECIES: response regulator transcription factor [unclassified Lysobacter]|uniref:response regulator n=1 Tax=unclassified Lysobacter TaxID=2635362 RepID=UPI001BE6CB66|nr:MULTISPECIES: response regulator transcription factor [unclassified Lysobacter]MBT2747883.1 response regulator transcription factor [Lysobacter sp. ISL-42]MBT2753777.1 response regulator transcription factor [Lysobacter sp. ISL-50]MBT2779065.1 response regulator transcription factor [Lysobacter sp. ISL-54]